MALPLDASSGSETHPPERPVKNYDQNPGKLNSARGGLGATSPLVRRWRGAVIAALAGGSLFTSCTGRIWASVIDGTRNYTLNLFDPQRILDLLPDDTADPATGP